MIDNVLRVGIKVDQQKRVAVKVRQNENRIGIKISENFAGGSKLPAYEGDYQVTPKTQEIVLPTKNKSMLDDVTVFQIPFKEVLNPQGGSTVTIGLE